MARKIKGTRVLKDGKRQIYVFVEREIGNKKKRFYRTELTQSESVKEISKRRARDEKRTARKGSG